MTGSVIQAMEEKVIKISYDILTSTFVVSVVTHRIFVS